MRKIYTIICGLLLGSAVMAGETESLGVITDKDFAQVGVPKENVIKAKEIIKGKRMAGQYGNVTVTVQNLKVVKVSRSERRKKWQF